MIELERTVRLFFQKHKLRTIGVIIAGIFILLLGWRVIGTCVIIYGFFLLFGYVLVLHLRLRVNGGWVMALNATFNNNSVISLWSV